MITVEGVQATSGVDLIERAVEVKGRRWTVIFTDLLAAALLDDREALTPAALTAITSCVSWLPTGKRARLRLVIRGVHMLALVLADTQSFRLYTPGAAQEAFVARLQPLAALQAHLDALRQHPPTLTTIEALTAQYALTDLCNPTGPLIEYDRAAFGEVVKGQVQALISLARAYRPGIVERLQNWFLDALADDDRLLRQLLRFVALLPSLRYDRSHRELVRALHENLVGMRRTQPAHGQSWPLRTQLIMWTARGLDLAARLTPPAFVGAFIEHAVGLMAARFIVPATSASVTDRLNSLDRLGRSASLDQLGELVLTEQEAEGYAEAVMRLIDLTAAHYGRAIDRRLVNGAGIPQAQVSVKLSALSTHFNPLAPEATAQALRERLLRILRHAKRRGAFLCFDAEHYAYRDLSLEIPAAVLASAPDLDDFQDFGFVVQAYLTDAVPFVERVADLAGQRGHRIQVRLVKGAYWDAETAEAEAQDVPAPTFSNKAETDIHFQQLVLRILQQSEVLALAVGSHNVREHAFAEVARAQLYPQAPVIEHQVLHRMSEGVARALSAMGWVTRDYVPVGDLVPGIAYLVRRILENASQVGILAQSRDRLSVEAGATDPAQTLSHLVSQGEYAWDPALRAGDEQFRPSPPVRLYLPGERRAFAETLAVTSVCAPACISAAEVAAMVDQAKGGAATWQAWSMAARSTILIRAAERMRAQRLELGALIVREGRKVWAEALADVDEAVDYLCFYARSAERWHDALPDRLQPLGVAAVIAPWNFPLAIPCGMTAAALAAGNAVLLKPAEQTPAIAKVLVEILHESGVPTDTLVYVPGDGRVGAALVANDQVDVVAFTGSWEVGAQIFATSARVPTRRLRRVIAETGSKNPLIVTASADLDTALDGILKSAFGHAGQKCSAGSRVLVDARLAQPLAERLALAARELCLGDAADAATQINPVITATEAQRLRTRAMAASAEVRAAGGRVMLDASNANEAADLVGPAIFLLPQGADLARVASIQEELFGPIVHIIPYNTRQEAVDLANSVPYALTAGVFAQSAEDVEFFARRLDAGNIYINRPITAARVGVEPFGGFKRSGTGPKAGGDDYLLAFMAVTPQEPESLTEMRASLVQAGREAMTAHPTVDIPGQLTRLVYDRPLGRGLVLADAPLYFRHAVVAAALLAGNEVTAIARSGDEALALQETATLAAAQAGRSGRLQIRLQSDVEVLTAEAPFAFVAGSEPALRGMARRYAENTDWTQLPAFMAPENGAPPELPIAFLRRFLRPRLIAENTIRHGALIATGGMWT